MASFPRDLCRCGTRPFDTLPDELISAILAKVVATSTNPACLAFLRSVSRRFYRLMADPTVLRFVAPRALLPHPAAWAAQTSCSAPPQPSPASTLAPPAPSPSTLALPPSASTTTLAGRSASRFMLLCGLAGNVDALFLLGMIKFYCQRDSRSGACLLVRAAEEGHVGALHALAAINAHGSGGSAADANPAVAAEVLWHAAVRGSRSALQELGHSYLVRPPIPFRPFRSIPSRRSALFLLPLSPHVSPSDEFTAKLFLGACGIRGAFIVVVILTLPRLAALLVALPTTCLHAGRLWRQEERGPGSEAAATRHLIRISILLGIISTVLALEETLNSLSGSLQEMVYEHEARARAEAGGVHFSSEEVRFNRGAPAATAAQPGQSVGGAMGGWFCDAQVSSAVVGAGVTDTPTDPPGIAAADLHGSHSRNGTITSSNPPQW
ncbi:unnamed protein product [Closterium sp. NIES-65]|nr:unnamed protein product [Closterium sp. NIES-65]